MRDTKIRSEEKIGFPSQEEAYGGQKNLQDKRAAMSGSARLRLPRGMRKFQSGMSKYSRDNSNGLAAVRKGRGYKERHVIQNLPLPQI